MKVGYLSLTGYRNTAYLDDDDVRDGPMRGEHKHTDAEVWVVWDQDKGEWLEVAAP